MNAKKLLVLLGLLLTPACAFDASEDVTASEDELRALTPGEIVGTLAYGETSAPTAYTKTPLYRAYRFDGQVGDEVEAWVRSTDGDARAWLLKPSFATIAVNETGAPGTTDARVGATLKETGTFYVVFRETTRKDATFTVSLKKLNGGAACGLPQVMTPTWEATSGRPTGIVLFDSKRNRLVTLTASGTSELTPSGWSAPAGDPLPAGRRPEAAIAYDSDRGRAVLFGGTDESYGLLGDTWEWDGATNAWTQMTPSGFTPRGRQGHALAYDAERKRVVLYGGIAGTQTQDLMEDTWTWDGSEWTRVGTAAAPHPEPRTGHHMAFDPVRGRVVLYGHQGPWMLGPVGGPNHSRANTWEWDGSSWARMSNEGMAYSDDPTALPMAFDAQRGRVVRVDLVGDRYRKQFVLLEWNGARWSSVSGSNGPSVDIASATTYSGDYDAARKRFVLASSGYRWKTQEHFLFAEPNRAPVPRVIPKQRAFAGEELVVQLSATDADGHAVSFAVSPMPAGATLDASTGLFKWAPSTSQVGSHSLSVTATDGCAAGTTALEITVDHLGYAGIPAGAVKLGGTVKVPVLARVPNRAASFEAWPELACTVSGDNPGKLTVACTGETTRGSAYPNDSTWFTPAPISAVLEANLKFKLIESASNGGRAFSGYLEALSDGTYKLFIEGYAMTLESGVRIERGGYYSSSPSYGVLDAVP